MFSNGVAPGVRDWEYDENASRDSPPERGPLVEEDRIEKGVDGKQLDGKPPDQLLYRPDQSSTIDTTALPFNEQDNAPTPTDKGSFLGPHSEVSTRTDMLRSREGTGPAAD